MSIKRKRLRGLKIRLSHEAVRMGWTIADIAEVFGLSRSTIRAYLEPEKMLARAQTNAAIRRGDLARPEVCERCGSSEKIECHHRNYADPLDVEWLCLACHGAEHGAGTVIQVCPVCGTQRERRVAGDQFETCSRSCSAKLQWMRRRGEVPERDTELRAALMSLMGTGLTPLEAYHEAQRIVREKKAA